MNDDGCQVSFGNNVKVDGPIVGSNVKLGQSVTTSFPTITTVPAGMPSNPTVYAQPLAPTNYSG